MSPRTGLRCLAATLAASALVAQPAFAASVAGMEVLESTTGNVPVVKFSLRGPYTAEVNVVTIGFTPGNRIVVTDQAGVDVTGKCRHPGANTTVAVCDANDAIGLDRVSIDLGPGNDQLGLGATPGLAPTTDIETGAGSDNVLGGPGVDTIYGGLGADRLRGAAGNDVILGEGDNDRLEGGPGGDRLEGGYGRDLLLGGLERDWLLGGPGNDVILSGPGNDLNAGGEGVDSVDGRRD